ncbi:MAG: phosphate propanoyltransferase [Spirochaetia bacterium]
MVDSNIEIPIEVSARHVHLSKDHVNALFGHGYKLTPVKMLSQPGQFAAEEIVIIRGPKNELGDVRILGPVREFTQVEVSQTDQYSLGLKVPIRPSGTLADTPGVTILGPAGKVELSQGVITAVRHIHMTPDDAERIGVEDRYVVRVKIRGKRELLYGDVLVRVNSKYRLAMHLDTDEANAADISGYTMGVIDSIQNTSGEI